MKTLDIYITKKCNLKCNYCYVDINKGKKEVEFKDLSILFRKINILEYTYVKFFGGEPLLKWKYIEDIIFYIRNINKHISFSIITNGLLLDNNKLDFCRNNNINLIVSVHYLGVKNIMRKINIFINYKNILSFSFIFEVGKLKFPYKYIFILQKFGFNNFILSPDIYSNWTLNNINGLEKQLIKLINLFLKNNYIKFHWGKEKRLDVLNKGCYKTVLGLSGLIYKCNRFKNLNKLKDYKYVYKIFNKVINYETKKYKWFFVCPIGWFLDSLRVNLDIKDRILQYKDLNYVFINFYKKINKIQNKNNLLSDNISMIRFNLTNKCNINCNYCYVTKNNLVLDYNIAKNYIDFYFFKKGKHKIIAFFGGEPLIEFNLLKNIVKYSKNLANKKGKVVNFVIATNFLLINKEKMDFLRKNNFDIHISLNGNKNTNDLMRDNSTDLLLNNFKEYLYQKKSLLKKVTILLAVSSKEVRDLYINLKYIYKLGFRNISLEFILSNKDFWKTKDFIILKNELIKFKKSNFYKKIKLLTKGKKYIDISVKGEISENSFNFHNYKANFKEKEIFDKLINVIF